MPVIGHAFVGLATASCTGRSTTTPRSVPVAPRGFALWLLIVVTLAYLPDVMSQLLSLAGWRHARVASHSLLFALVASALIVPALTRLVPLSYRRAFAISLFSIAAHILLDALQATDRMPLWPASSQQIGFGRAVIPTDLGGELLLFGSAFLIVLAVRKFGLRAQVRECDESISNPEGNRSVWISRGAIAAIVFTAATVHHFRDLREFQLDRARRLVERGDYTGALTLLETTRRWPSTVNTSRIDYTTAEAYAGLCDWLHAERYYLRAHEADPTYFWALADLAVLSASADLPIQERRRQAAPYVAALKRRFPDHEALSRTLARIDRKLAVAARHAPSHCP